MSSSMQEDPLEGYGGLSLFSRSFACLPSYSHTLLSGDPHNFLMSLPVQNPDKLVEQAKTILDNTTEIPNVGMISDATLEEEKNEVIDDMAVRFPRGQRPGLQRKRARFSLLHSVSQPTVNLEPTLDFTKGPEEFFLAFERRENSKKEEAKYKGGTYTGSDQYNVFKVPQSERPGIPERSRKAKYKHLYPDIPSQKTCEGNIAYRCGLQQEAAQLDVASQQTEPDSVESQQFESTYAASQLTESATLATEELEMTSSIAKAEKTVNQLIDELLGDGYGGVEGDGAINLLEERLQIKPLHMEKLNLPEMQDVLKIDFTVSGVNPPKFRNVLSDINNLLAGTRNRTPAKLKSMETSVPNFGSPTPPKSPLASLSLLNKHIFQSNPSRDPFAAIGIDQSPARNSFPVDNINKCSDPVGSEKALCIPGKLKSTAKEDDVPDDGRSSTEVAIKGSTSSFQEHLNEILTSLGSGSGINMKEAGSELEGNNIDICNEFVNENLSQADAHVDHDDLEDIVEDATQDAEASAEPNQNTDYSPMETSNSNQNGLDPATVEDQPVDESAECVNSASLQNQDTSLEQTQSTSSTLQTEKMNETSVESPDELTRRKTRPLKERKSKNLSRRQSLAGCGMSWEAGVRRSTRIRSRPLEYWRGERFLYGRIHESLATVIGIKYESPGKEKGGLKVKSFVSEEHKHLFDQSAV